jgi:hypothetical protein
VCLWHSDHNSFFLQVFTSIIHGLLAVVALNQGLPIGTRNETMYKLWGLNHTTPGAIAGSAVLVHVSVFPLRFEMMLKSVQARWALSQDDYLQERGVSTGINWLSKFESYLNYLLQGLHQHKASVLNIFQVWDETFFPNANTSLAGKCGQSSNNEESMRNALEAWNADEEDLGNSEGMAATLN